MTRYKFCTFEKTSPIAETRPLRLWFPSSVSINSTWRCPVADYRDPISLGWGGGVGGLHFKRWAQWGGQKT